MKFPIYCATGAVAGLIGAAVWAGIAYATNHEIGWIAWGIGFLVGFAVRIGAGDSHDGALPGVTAAVIAVLAIVVGKYATASLLVGQHMPTPDPAAPATFISQMADEIAKEHQAAGKPVNWPAGKSLENAEAETDYPPEIWQEATKKWSDLGPAGQQKMQDERIEGIKKLASMMKGSFTWMAFKGSFGPIDIVFFLLAIATAFKLGSAMQSD